MEGYKTDFVSMRQELREYLDQGHKDESPVTASALATILEFLSIFHQAVQECAKKREGHIYRSDILSIQKAALRQCIVDLQYFESKLKPMETLQ